MSRALEKQHTKIKTYALPSKPATNRRAQTLDHRQVARHHPSADRVAKQLFAAEDLDQEEAARIRLEGRSEVPKEESMSRDNVTWRVNGG